jgi:hypothetical protein
VVNPVGTDRDRTAVGRSSLRISPELRIRPGCDEVARGARSLTNWGTKDRASQARRSHKLNLNFIFRCPNTGMNVQHRIDAPPASAANEVVAVHCLACSRPHLINVNTFEVLGQKRGDGR